MAAQQKPESTAVAVRDGAVGNLPAAVQQQLELRRAQNAVVAQIAGMNWGKALDIGTRRAVADWGQRFRVDVTTEIDVLGANIYLNARYYLRRLAELIARGVVEYAYADHVEDDPRLTKLGAEGEGETTRRLRERIKHGIPDKATGAVVFRIKLNALTKEITGASWCGGGTRKSDPVGEAEPVKTAESRAARRAVRQIASHLPDVAQEIEAVATEAEVVTARIHAAHEQDARDVTERVALARGTAGASAQNFGGYDSTGDMERITPKGEVPDPMQEDFIDDRDLADEEER